MDLINRYRGSLMGLAVGDALGTTLEFKSPGSFEPITTMTGGGPFCLDPGEWTDDTAMALCLAESLIECSGFDAGDQMSRYVRWYREGYLSSTGVCFDIGTTVKGALQRFEQDQNPMAGEVDPDFGGNGSLMRLAPIALAYAREPEKAIRYAQEMSRTTHGAAEPVDACRYYSGLIVGALAGQPKSVLLSDRFSPLGDFWASPGLSPKISAIAEGSFKVKHPPDIKGTGYVVDTLEAALWAFWTTNSFEQGALLAVNLGDDADTTGAIYGQLAGAYYGLDEIPAQWRKPVAMKDHILGLAERLVSIVKIN